MNIKFFGLLLIAFLSSSPTLAQRVEDSKKIGGQDAIYRLDSGDKLRLIVYGEADLSGEFEVDGSGTVSLPLIGNVSCQNLSLRELEVLVTEKFKDGYLISPKVSIEVLNFRPFFILGEVKKPGSYNYVSGLTALNAVALAGGFSYRAKQDDFTIIRVVAGKREEIEAKEDTLIMPGDSLRIEERFF